MHQKGNRDTCFSLQETAFAMIGEAVERALSFTGKKELLVVGGVAANKRLSEMLASVCKRHECKFFVAPQRICRRLWYSNMLDRIIRITSKERYFI